MRVIELTQEVELLSSSIPITEENVDDSDKSRQESPIGLNSNNSWNEW